MKTILLDTNVLSELMRPQPAAEVLAWFAGQTDNTFCISAITQAEILLGIALLPAGRRRDALSSAAIARTQGLPLATRNVKDFVGIAGVAVLNPWEG